MFKKILGLAVIIGVGWFGFRFLAPPVVEVASPQWGPAVQSIYATGTVEPTVMVPLSARMMGRIVELFVDEGAEVQEGQKLVRLEDEDLQNGLKELVAREEIAGKEYKRNLPLAEKGIISKNELETFQANFTAATAAVRRARAEAGYMTISAPKVGRIIRRDGEIGEQIPANQPVLWMAGSEPLRITATVDEEDIPDVKESAKVLINADAFPGQVFIGKVKSITEKGDPTARSFRIRIELPTDTPLRVGMTAESNIIVSEKERALLIPTDAISRDLESWVVVDSKLQKRNVVIGARGPKLTEVLSGIVESDRVAVGPVDKLKLGERVRTKNRE